LELSYIFNSGAKFALADNRLDLGVVLGKLAGAFGFISALSGFYLLCHGLCAEVSPFSIPIGEIHYFKRKAANQADG
jgi:succinate-acetate transporter protein